VAGHRVTGSKPLVTSKTMDHSMTSAGGDPGEKESLAESLQSASVVESIRFSLLHFVPYLLRGVFTKNQFWTFVFDAVDSDAHVVKFCQQLRSKYRSNLIYIRMIGGKSLLVFSENGIRRVLNNSPSIYGDAELKAKGMSHFQPNALTISEGEEWKDRRQFNEAVLNSRQGVHEFSDAFLEVIRREVGFSLGQINRYFGLEDFDRLFKRIMLQVIFGSDAYRDAELPDQLHQMMVESNRIFLLGKSKEFDAFYGKIRNHLTSPRPSSLTGLCPHAPQTDTTRVENQIPHWMFAMMETLATNTLRGLALILAHPAVEERVRLKIHKNQSFTAADIHSLTYLEGCLQEAMRLWPTTAMLARKTLAEDELCGNLIPAKTQVIILNSFNHRDSETHYFADSFKPELWVERPADYHFNHLSNGTQGCAGKNLALFIGTAVLAEFLRQGRYRLCRPTLHATHPLPHSFNEFQTRLERISPF
jgi:cytochrome P450